MFFCNYLGQEVIDHSGDIFQRMWVTYTLERNKFVGRGNIKIQLSIFLCDVFYRYNVQWYMAPLKVQKLLLLMMQRSMRHCTIIIGGLFIPSLEGFATVKISVSNNNLLWLDCLKYNIFLSALQHVTFIFYGNLFSSLNVKRICHLVEHIELHDANNFNILVAIIVM